MDYEFDRGIEVTRPAERGVRRVPRAGWVVGGGVNGGYLLAVIGNAVRARPAGPARPGQHECLLPERLHAGARPGARPAGPHRRSAPRSPPTWSRTAAGRADHRPGDLRRPGPVPREVRATAAGRTCRRSRTACRGPAPEEVRRMAPLLERFGTRIDPAYVGWAVGKPSGSGIIQGWFKLADDRPLDPIALLMVVDALPPVTFDLGLPGWAPTLELTAHVRARPAPGWAMVAARHPHHRGWSLRGGLRGLGLRRSAGRPVPPAGAASRPGLIGSVPAAHPQPRALTAEHPASPGVLDDRPQRVRPTARS